MDDTENTTETAEEPASPTSYLSVIFTDDHNIEGMKVEVRNITPLQITAAIYYLQRAANRLADAVEFQQMQKAEKDRLVVATDIAAVTREIQQGRRN